MGEQPSHGAPRATDIVKGDDSDDDSLFAEYREAGGRGKRSGGGGLYNV